MADRIIFACILLLAGVYFWATAQIPTLELGDPLGPKAFPRLLGIGLLISAAMLLAEILRNRKQQKTAAAPIVWRWDPRQWIVVAIAVWTALYILAFEWLGYMLSTVIYLLVLTSCFNRGRHLMNGLTCVLFVIISYVAFNKLLGVNLAPGIIPF